MDENKQISGRTAGSAIKPIPFWGNIVIAALGLLANIILLRAALQLPDTAISYVARAFHSLVILATSTVILLTIRGHQRIAAHVVFYTALALFASGSFVYAESVFSASFSLLTIVTIIISQLLPGESRRRAMILTGGALLITWMAAWLDPSWRLPASTAAGAGLAASILFVLILSAILIRRVGAGSIRVKLVASFTLITVLSVAGLASINYYYDQSNLADISGAALKSAANSQAVAIGDALSQEIHVLQSFNLNKFVQDQVDEVNASYGPDSEANLRQIQLLDAQWRAADQADNNYHPLVSGVINGDAASELKEFREAFPENVEVFVTDKYGANVAASNRTSDYFQGDEDWWQAAYNNGEGAIYIGQPEFDQSSNTFALVLAVPVYSHGTQEVSGVMRTTLNIQSVLTVLDARILGDTGQTDLYLPSGQVLDSQNAQGVHPADPTVVELLPELTTVKPFATFTFEGVPSVVSASLVTSKNPTIQTSLESLRWQVVVHQDEADYLTPIREQTQTTTVFALLIIVIGSIATMFLAQSLSAPVVRLTRAVEQNAAGEIVQASVETMDEIGTLARSFNSMTLQLHDLIGSLEQRVTDRTKDLATVAEVGTATASILESGRLLQEVVDLTKERFHLYHAHVYLMDESGENLVLTAGAGEPGRIMVAEGRSIPLDREQSLVARAARERKGVTVNDVTQAPDFLPNPLLPNTRSELAVPMIVGSKLVGVFDIQSDQAGRFTESDIHIQTTLASLVGTSIQNVRTFERSQKQAELESLINTIGQKIQRATSIEETLQVGIRELGLALGAPDVSARITRPEDSSTLIGSN